MPEEMTHARCTFKNHGKLHQGLSIMAWHRIYDAKEVSSW